MVTATTPTTACATSPTSPRENGRSRIVTNEAVQESHLVRVNVFWCGTRSRENVCPKCWAIPWSWRWSSQKAWSLMMLGGIMCGKESGDALIFDGLWGYHCPLSRTGIHEWHDIVNLKSILLQLAMTRQGMTNYHKWWQTAYRKSSQTRPVRVGFGRDPHVTRDQDCILVNFFKDSLYKEQLGSMDFSHDEIMTKRMYTKEMRHTITGMICTLQGN